MAYENSRLIRTINELAEFNFTIVYRPGSDNLVADALSRLNMNVEEARKEPCLPNGYKRIEEIPGGGNSLFQALCSAIKNTKLNEYLNQIPTDHLTLRETIVDHFLANLKKFKINTNREKSKFFKAMRNAGQLPSEDILLAMADLFKIEIRVFHGMLSPITYKFSKESTENPIIYLE